MNDTERIGPFSREEFGKMLAGAQHQDAISSWPKWAQCFHRWLVAWRCPACEYWKKGKG